MQGRVPEGGVVPYWSPRWSNYRPVADYPKESEQEKVRRIQADEKRRQEWYAKRGFKPYTLIPKEGK